MSRVTNEFCWTDDEIQIFFESVNQCKCNCEFEGINWEKVR